MSRSTVIYLLVFLVTFAHYLAQGARDRGLDALPEPGDGHDYDALAYNLWHHGQFAFNWSDPGWRAPYSEDPTYRDLLNRRSDLYSTTYRQPFMPLVLAAVYSVTDRSFAAWRILSCGLTAAAVTASAAIAMTIAGPLAAVATGLLTLYLPLVTLFSYQFRPESLTSLLVALLALIWTRTQVSGWTTRAALASGLVLGALMATRSVFALWLPMAWFAPDLAKRAGDRITCRTRVVCLAAALAVITPWWVRNVIVLDAFMPLGTQGGYNLPAGFGPRALRFEGMWASNPDDGLAEIEALRLDPITEEVRIAQFRTALAARWIVEHPLDTVRLMYLHVWQEIRPRVQPAPTGAWLLPVAVLAAIVLRRRPGVLLILVMVGLNLLGIALTWSVAGRFMAPVQPIMAALPGGLIGVAGGWIVRVGRKLSAW